MVPDLLKLIHKAQSLTLHAGSDMKDLFLKDAIYKAAGLPAFNLFDEVSQARLINIQRLYSNHTIFANSNFSAGL